MKYKNGVVRKGSVNYNSEWHDVEWSKELMYGMGVFEQISIDVAAIEPVVTCGIEGVHSTNSLHPKGRAVDFRTSYYSGDQAREIVRRVKAKIDKEFDIILESNHIHFERDLHN